MLRMQNGRHSPPFGKGGFRGIFRIVIKSPWPPFGKEGILGGFRIYELMLKGIPLK